jgi:hypothetical protein
LRGGGGEDEFLLLKLSDEDEDYVNTSIHTLYLDYRYSQHELYRESVFPYLETNRFRLRVRAIQKSCPFVYRAKVLGQALFAARIDPNRFCMFLLGNAEVAFPSTTATTTPATRTNLPAPSTATATSNTAAVAVTTAVTATMDITWAASGTGTSDAVQVMSLLLLLVRNTR